MPCLRCPEEEPVKLNGSQLVLNLFQHLPKLRWTLKQVHDSEAFSQRDASAYAEPNSLFGSTNEI